MSKSTRIIHLVQFITVEPIGLRCTYHLGATAYRHAHATLRSIDAMWAGTTPCHVHTASTLAPVAVASC